MLVMLFRACSNRWLAQATGTNEVQSDFYITFKSNFFDFCRMKTISIFISSPGDVGRERRSTAEVIQRLQNEFAEHALIKPYFWEWEPVDFAKDYQANIPSTADFDIVICLLWSRLGSRLGKEHKLPPDYSRTASSGTEYELLQALHGKQHHPENLPDLLVWVNKAPPPAASSPPLSKAERDERNRQTDALHDFLGTLTRDASTGVFTAAINSYCIPDADLDHYEFLDQFEELMEQKLRKLIQKHVGNVDIKTKGNWTGSPFRDLNVFEFEHSPIFFGRSRAVGEVVRLLQETSSKLKPCHFALVLGASGSGKSSLARAGVLPMLTSGGVIEGVGLWRCAIMRPSDDGSDLFVALAAALLRGVSNGCPPALPELADLESTRAIHALADKLRSDPNSVAIRVELTLAEAARSEQTRQRDYLKEEIRTLTAEGRSNEAEHRRQALDQLKTPPIARLSLLLDQMEELFTLNYSADQLHAFLSAIDVLARCGRVFVLGTLRSDFYPRYQEQTQLVALTTDGSRYDLLPPNADEISQIIRNPARLAGLEFEEDPLTRHSLADTLRDEAMKDAEALPLLEHVLNRLYEAQQMRNDWRLTFGDHKTLGGVGGALGKHAEALFTGALRAKGEPLPPWNEATFDAVFRCLITLGEGELEVPNRRTFPKTTLLKVDKHALELVTNFENARLFVADQDAQGNAVVRLSHEALLTRWPRLSQWLQTAQVRDFMSMRRRLESSLRQWQEQEQNDDYLLPHGLPLEEAKQLMKKHAAALKKEEKEFIEASSRVDQEREFRNTRKRRIAFAVLSILTVLSLLGGGMALWLKMEAEEQRSQVQSLLAESDYERSERLFNEDDASTAIWYLSRSVASGSASEHAKDRLWFAMRQRSWPQKIAQGKLLDSDILAITSDATHERFAVSTHGGQVRVLSCSTGEIIAELPLHPRAVRGVQFSPDGKTLLTGCDDAVARMWSIKSSTIAPTGTATHDNLVAGIAWSSDSRHFATGSWDKHVRVWDMANPLAPVFMREMKDKVHTVAYNPKHKNWLLSVAKDEVCVWDTEQNLEKFCYQALGDLSGAVFSPDGSKLLSFTDEGDVAISDLTTGIQQWAQIPLGGVCGHGEFSHDGSQIALVSNKRVVVYSVQQPPQMIWDHVFATNVRLIRYADQDNRLIIACSDGRVEVYDAVNQRRLSEPIQEEGGVVALDFHSNKGVILCATSTRKVSSWRLAPPQPMPAAAYFLGAPPLSLNAGQSITSVAENGSVVVIPEDQESLEAVAQYRNFKTPLTSAAVHPRGESLVGGAIDGRLLRIDLSSKGDAAEVGRFKSPVTKVAFSNAGNILAGGSEDGQLARWSWPDMKPVTLSHRHKDKISGLSLMEPNGQILALGWDRLITMTQGAATAGATLMWKIPADPFALAIASRMDFAAAALSDASIYYIDGAGGTCTALPNKAGNPPGCIAISDDGMVIAVGTVIGNVEIFDRRDVRKTIKINSGEDTINSIRFSHSGRWLAVAGEDGHARIWDVATGHPVTEKLPHKSGVRGLAFTSNGKFLVCADKGGAVTFWPVSGPASTLDLEEVAGQISGVQESNTRSTLPDQVLNILPVTDPDMLLHRVRNLTSAPIRYDIEILKTFCKQH